MGGGGGSKTVEVVEYVYEDPKHSITSQQMVDLFGHEQRQAGQQDIFQGADIVGRRAQPTPTVTEVARYLKDTTGANVISVPESSVIEGSGGIGTGIEEFQTSQLGQITSNIAMDVKAKKPDLPKVALPEPAAGMKVTGVKPKTAEQTLTDIQGFSDIATSAQQGGIIPDPSVAQQTAVGFPGSDVSSNLYKQPLAPITEQMQRAKLGAQEGLRVPETLANEPELKPEVPEGKGEAMGLPQLFNKPGAGKDADDIEAIAEPDDFILNSKVKEIEGEKDIDAMLAGAIDIANRKGYRLSPRITNLPKDKVVPLLVSKDEIRVPKVLAKIIGYDKLTKMNNRGKAAMKAEEQRQATGQQVAQAKHGGEVHSQKKKFKDGGSVDNEPVYEKEPQFVGKPPNDFLKEYFDIYNDKLITFKDENPDSPTYNEIETAVRFTYRGGRNHLFKETIHSNEVEEKLKNMSPKERKEWDSKLNDKVNKTLSNDLSEWAKLKDLESHPYYKSNPYKKWWDREPLEPDFKHLPFKRKDAEKLGSLKQEPAWERPDPKPFALEENYSILRKAKGFKDGGLVDNYGGPLTDEVLSRVLKQEKLKAHLGADNLDTEENRNKLLDFANKTAGIESNYGKNVKNPTTTAKGDFQFTDDSFITGKNRLARYDIKLDSNSPLDLSKDEATALFFANIDQQIGSSADIGNLLLNKPNASEVIYTKYHYKKKLDEPTKLRVNKYYTDTKKVNEDTLLQNTEVPFVDRILNPENYIKPKEQIDSEGRSFIETHRMSSRDNWAFPTVVIEDNKYIDLMDRYKGDINAVFDHNKKTGDILRFPSDEEAQNFSMNYKDIPSAQKFNEYYTPDYSKFEEEDRTNREKIQRKIYDTAHTIRPHVDRLIKTGELPQEQFKSFMSDAVKAKVGDAVVDKAKDLGMYPNFLDEINASAEIKGKDDFSVRAGDFEYEENPFNRRIQKTFGEPEGIHGSVEMDVNKHRNDTYVGGNLVFPLGKPKK